MNLRRIKETFPSGVSVGLALLAAVLLILAFPDIEFAPAAFVAFLPLLFALEREKGSAVKAFTVGWIFGTIFFKGTCWWLTFAPITYAAFPAALAYFLLVIVCMIVGLFPGIFAVVMALLFRRFGFLAVFAAPFVWVFTEFLRYWLTGNNWNAVGYSQAFFKGILNFAEIGGVSLVSFLCLIPAAVLYYAFNNWPRRRIEISISSALLVLFVLLCNLLVFSDPTNFFDRQEPSAARIIAIQPNVPMSGLSYQKWQQLRQRHIEMAEAALRSIREDQPSAVSEQRTAIGQMPTVVVFPESPMNFMYDEDEETKSFINGFTRRNNVNVLFNSAEPDAASGKYFNSAVMVGPQGTELVQYDKIYLVPFGESVPAPLQAIIPAFVGSFAYGSEYDLFPLGGENGPTAGVMICFESHFGQLGREYVQRGADVLIEMTNDGYLGPTPVLRQHLANAVFRAVETNRPVLRVTNVGITAYINAKGEVIDPANVYQEDTRIWSVAKSDGSQTFYVRYGDWFAWLCTIITAGLFAYAIFRRRQ
ncbi:MAG: apolipoprotein N-acyltransferase [Acidobacteria bacterium]|nr:apolipoprotein N-acyltransferase [Acidobacteriota bacterium]